MKRNPIPRGLALSLLALAALPAAAKYGDIAKIKGDGDIPSGWVILKAECPVTYSTGAPVEQPLSAYTLTIKDLNGAALNAVETVITTSPIPDGWVIAATKTPNPYSAASTVYEIKYTKGAAVEQKATYATLSAQPVLRPGMTYAGQGAGSSGGAATMSVTMGAGAGAGAGGGATMSAQASAAKPRTQQNRFTMGTR